jgi:hypothetical protein
MGGVCVFVAAWAWYARMNVDRVEWRAVPWWKALREALFFQIVWAFYRAVVSTQTSNAVYVSFICLALVSVSWLLNPFRRTDPGDLPRAYPIARDWTLALLTAFAAVALRPLWLLVLMHCTWLGVSDRILKSMVVSRS